MSRDVDEVADAVLHEGYLLYPYAASALKNLHRYPFGTLYPEAFCRALEEGDRSFARLEIVVLGGSDARLSVRARFLQILDSDAVVRDAELASLSLAELSTAPHSLSFAFAPLRGEIIVSAVAAEEHVWRVSAELRSSTPIELTERTTRDEALRHALASAHLLIRSEGAELVSAIDPPARVRALVESSRSVGLWPVLVGSPGARDALLAAPIILYDYPELAPESPGDFFDATEMDGLLTLRILTLTEAEKRAMAASDPRARVLLERTEASGLASLAALHGRLSSPPALRPGTSVRLRPARGGDVFDLALDGRLATVHAVEHDFEGRVHVAVTVDDDPGKDLGPYGHRFFFRPDELEIL